MAPIFRAKPRAARVRSARRGKLPATLVSLAVVFVAVLIAIGALLLLVPLGSLVRWCFRRELEWGIREYLREHRHGSERAPGSRG